MNTSPRRPRFFKSLGFLIAICAIAGLSSCSSSVKLDYVNWEVQFTKETSELDKAIAMDSVRRYILHHLSGQQYTGLILKQIDITSPDWKDRDRAPIKVGLIFDRAGRQAVPPPPVPGGPGHDYILPERPGIPIIPHVSNIVNAER